MAKKKGTGLKYVTIEDMRIIPRYLFEQIEPKSFKVDNIYKYGHLFINSPLSIIGAFVEKDFSVKGFIWFAIDPLAEKLVVQFLSIDKEYQGKGIMKEALNITRKVEKEQELNGLLLATTRQRALGKLWNAIPSKTVLMEV